MRKLIAAVALTTAVTAVGTTAASAAPAADSTRHQSLHAWTLLNEHGPGPNPGERLTVRVEAHANAGHQARGRAVVEHVFPGGYAVRGEMSIDCLSTDGAAVTVTGPLESLHFTVPAGENPPPAPPSTWHPEAGLTFYPADEHGERRVGWSGANALDYSAPAQATKCMPTAPSTWVIQGGFTLRR
ncbi:hypothetical protein F4556_005846 [Kitasatospora gansuensis]|uniref:Uncharacterized protein n=1 Tax=Kitasatospora gansuensis TaxID=258050 RepID=A0A7W7WKE3_9ACTN|nr:hypothetical protein [Kitasatospora gansuensis]MBB4950311.1 hypothetical protein [Kitasatospora gansuensis]